MDAIMASDFSNEWYATTKAWLCLKNIFVSIRYHVFRYSFISRHILSYPLITINLKRIVKVLIEHMVSVHACMNWRGHFLVISMRFMLYEDRDSLTGLQ